MCKWRSSRRRIRGITSESRRLKITWTSSQQNFHPPSLNPTIKYFPSFSCSSDGIKSNADTFDSALLCNGVTLSLVVMFKILTPCWDAQHTKFFDIATAFTSVFKWISTGKILGFARGGRRFESVPSGYKTFLSDNKDLILLVIWWSTEGDPILSERDMELSLSDALSGEHCACFGRTGSGGLRGSSENEADRVDKGKALGELSNKLREDELIESDGELSDRVFTGRGGSAGFLDSSTSLSEESPSASASSVWEETDFGRARSPPLGPRSGRRSVEVWLAKDSVADKAGRSKMTFNRSGELSEFSKGIIEA